MWWRSYWYWWTGRTWKQAAIETGWLRSIGRGGTVMVLNARGYGIQISSARGRWNGKKR